MSVRVRALVAGALLMLCAAVRGSAGNAAGGASSSTAKAEGKGVGGGCQDKLLEAFQLDGVGSDKPVAMTICPAVSAANNCCSVVDEIKAVKAWNNFSKPKLNLFVEDTIGTIRRMVSLQPFVRNLNDLYIRFHYKKTVKRVSQVRQCFDRETLLSVDNYQELVTEASAGKEWYYVYAKMYIDKIIAQLIAGNAQSGFSIKPFSTPENANAIGASLLANPVVVKQLRSIDNDYVYNDGIVGLVDAIQSAFVRMGDVPEFKAKTDADKLAMVRTSLGVQAAVRAVVVREQINKRVRKDIEEEAYSRHMKNIVKFVMKYSPMFIPESAMPKNQRVAVLANAIVRIQRSAYLKRALVFFWGIEPIKNPANIKKIKEIDGQIAALIRKAIEGHERMSAAATGALVNDFALAYHKVSNLRELLFEGALENTRAYVYAYLGTEALKAVEAQNPAARPKLIEMYKSCLIPAMKDEAYKVRATGLVDAASDVQYAPDYIKHINSILDKCLTPLQLGPLPDIDFRSLYSSMLKSLSAVMSSSIFVADAKTPTQVCAKVFKASLVDQITFNREKFNHCRKSLLDLLQVDTQSIMSSLSDMKAEMTKMIDLKKTAYCVVCDKELSKFVDIKARSVAYSEGFCTSMLKTFDKYLQWKNVTLMQYQNKLYQYLQCYTRDGSGASFPYQYFAQSQLELSAKFEQCKVSADKAVACRPLCEQFNLFNYSEFFDGERDSITRMYNSIVNTIRMFGFKFERRSTRTADGAVSTGQQGSRVLAELLNDEGAAANKRNLLDSNESHFDVDDHHQLLDRFYGNSKPSALRLLQESSNINSRKLQQRHNNRRHDDRASHGSPSSQSAETRQNQAPRSQSTTQVTASTGSSQNSNNISASQMQQLERSTDSRSQSSAKLDVARSNQASARNNLATADQNLTSLSQQNKANASLLEQQQDKLSDSINKQADIKVITATQDEISSLTSLLEKGKEEMEQAAKARADAEAKLEEATKAKRAAARMANKDKKEQEKVLTGIAATLGVSVNDVIVKVPLLFSEKIKMIRSELASDKMMRKERPNYITELTRTNLSFAVMSPLITVETYTSTIQPKGIDPLVLVQNANLDAGVVQKFLTPAATSGDEEEWDPQAVRAYVLVNSKDLANFNNDIKNLTFESIKTEASTQKTANSAKPNADSAKPATPTGNSKVAVAASTTSPRSLRRNKRRVRSSASAKRNRATAKSNGVSIKTSSNSQTMYPQQVKHENGIKSFLMKLLF